MPSLTQQGLKGLGPLLILLVSLLMLSVTSWCYSQSELMFNDFTFLSCLLASNLVILFAALIGVFGHKKNNGFLLCIFQVFAMIFCVVFFLIGIKAATMKNSIFEGNCRESKNQDIEMANKAYEYSSATLCTPLCPCSLDMHKLDTTSYSLEEKIILRALKTKWENGANNFQECPSSEKFDDSYHRIFGLLGKIEAIRSCAGWCGEGPQLFYKFSNVNDGKPI